MAAPVLLYLLKANAALLLFAAAYFGLLRRLTFFTLNRVYLVFALLFAAVYPALPVPALLPAEAAAPVAIVVMEASGVGQSAPAGPVAPPIDWATAGLGLYAIGAAVLLARLLVQLLSLRRLRRQSRPAVVKGLPVRVLAGAVSPFSFWQTIYLNPDQHPAPELAAVLRHEQVHTRQWHTLDVLLAQLALAATWCNPAAWLLRRALLDNLEFLADHAVLQAGLDRRAYQYSLLRLSHEAAGPSLVSHFTFPTLKNRVIMMNTPLSSTGQLVRYFVAGPLVLATALGFSAARAQSAPPAATATHRLGAASPVYYLDGQLADAATANALAAGNVEYMSVLKGQQAQQLFGQQAAAGAVIITTKANAKTAAVLAFNQKVNQVASLVPATPAQNAAIATGKAYITKMYPNATLRFIGPDPSKTGGAAPYYKAEFEDGGKTTRLYFDATGQPTGAPEKAVGSMYLAAPALAYITKNYPEARLIGVTETRASGSSTPQYRAEIAVGRRPQYLLFDERGQFITK